MKKLPAVDPSSIIGKIHKEAKLAYIKTLVDDLTQNTKSTV